MEPGMEVAGELSRPAETLKRAEQMLRITKLAWLASAKTESQASKIGRQKGESRRVPIPRIYLRLLSLEI